MTGPTLAHDFSSLERALGTLASMPQKSPASERGTYLPGGGPRGQMSIKQRNSAAGTAALQETGMGLSGSQEVTNNRMADTQALKQNTMAAQENLRVKQMAMRNNAMLSNSLLQINMSLLGVMFGYQNFTKAVNAGDQAELQTLQMKEKKSKADKKRIKQLREEQIEQQKVNTYMMAGISALQFLFSMSQIVLSVKTRMSAVNVAEASTGLAVARANQEQAKTGLQAAGASAAKQSVSAGPIIGIGVLALLLGLIATAVIGVQAFGAAEGAFVPRTSGGIPFVVGEGNSDEIISPVPKMKQTMREVIREGGGRTVIINAIDTESFSEVVGNTNFINGLRGA